MTNNKIKVTYREYEIAELMSKGLSNKQIAETLGLSWKTINTRIHNLYTALDITHKEAQRTKVMVLFLNGKIQKPTHRRIKSFRGEIILLLKDNPDLTAREICRKLQCCMSTASSYRRKVLHSSKGILN